MHIKWIFTNDCLYSNESRQMIVKFILDECKIKKTSKIIKNLLKDSIYINFKCANSQKYFLLKNYFFSYVACYINMLTNLTIKLINWWFPLAEWVHWFFWVTKDSIGSNFFHKGSIVLINIFFEFLHIWKFYTYFRIFIVFEFFTFAVIQNEFGQSFI